MTTKIKSSNVFIVALMVFSILNFSPKITSASQGMCIAGGSTNGIECFATCLQQSNEVECTAIDQRASNLNSSNLSASSLLSQGYITDCRCVWVPDNNTGEYGGGPQCGNGYLETGEQCDAGTNNGPSPKTCSTSCRSNDTIPDPVCDIVNFSAGSSPLAYNTGTTLQFSFRNMSDPASPDYNYNFPWQINLVGGSGLPSPNTGTGASGTSLTGNLIATKTYNLICGNDSQPLTIPVDLPPGPPAEYCNDPAATNNGGALPCDYTQPVVGNLCSPMSHYAGVRTEPGKTCAFQTTTQVANEAECITWCNSNNADGCEINAAGTCYRYSGDGCYLEFNPDWSWWRASVDQCYPNPPYLTPSVSGYPSCVPNGQTSYTAQISWTPTVQNDIFAVFYNINAQPFRDFIKRVWGGSGSTSGATGFTQRTGPSPAQSATFAPGITYKASIENMSENDGPTVQWSVPQCTYDPHDAWGNLDLPATDGTCSNFSGWAWDPDFPDTPTTVKIVKDGVVVNPAYDAGTNRGDLQGAGIGNGNHAFTYITPDSWKDGNTHTVNIYANDRNGGNGLQLGGSPKTINCSPVPPTGMSGTLSGPAVCKINRNESTCKNVPIDWTLNNPESSLTYMERGLGGGFLVSDSLTPANQGDTEFIEIPYNGDAFVLKNHGANLASLNIGAVCKTENGDEWSITQQKCILRVGVCGDGHVDEEFEQCDDGNQINNDGCTNTCTIPPKINPPECGTNNYTCKAPSALLPNSSKETPSAYSWQCKRNDNNKIVSCNNWKTDSKKPIFIED
jgi:cysteine-rich repeat protein